MLFTLWAMPLIIFHRGRRGGEGRKKKSRCHLRRLPSPQITAAFHSPYGPPGICVTDECCCQTLMSSANIIHWRQLACNTSQCCTAGTYYQKLSKYLFSKIYTQIIIIVIIFIITLFSLFFFIIRPIIGGVLMHSCSCSFFFLHFLSPQMLHGKLPLKWLLIQPY